MISGIGALNPLGRLGETAGVGDGPAGVGGTAATPETSFAQLLADGAREAVGTLRGAEEMSVKAMRGDADTRDVVDAVMSAEQTLQAAIAIRDKIVTAYLEVSRMAI